jgi:hypothetical protein
MGQGEEGYRGCMLEPRGRVRGGSLGTRGQTGTRDHKMVSSESLEVDPVACGVLALSADPFLAFFQRHRDIEE